MAILSSLQSLLLAGTWTHKGGWSQSHRTRIKSLCTISKLLVLTQHIDLHCKRVHMYSKVYGKIYLNQKSETVTNLFRATCYTYNSLTWYPLAYWSSFQPGRQCCSWGGRKSQSSARWTAGWQMSWAASDQSRCQSCLHRCTEREGFWRHSMALCLGTG